MYQFEYDLKKKKKKKIITRVLVILLLILALVSVIYYLLSQYKVNTVYVDGNVHYSDEEVRNLVMDGPLGDNSLYLSLKYKNKNITEVPFVDALQVSILSKDTIRITMYEKAIAGYVVYLGKYMYFDKDGTVIESSSVKTSGVCQITGLSFDYMVLGKQLPVSNESIFKKILNTNQLLTKYGLDCQVMDFDGAGNMTLIFDEVRVELGSKDDIDQMIMLLPQLLPNLEGKKGVLDMKNDSRNSDSITFIPDSRAN